MKRIATMSVLLAGLFGLFINVGFAAEMKRIILLRAELMPPLTEYILEGLKQEGFVNQENISLTEITISATTDVAQIVAQITQAQPDVVLNIVEFGDILTALQGLSIPVITRVNVEPYVNAEGIPTANITGLYTTLKDMFYHSYKFLQKVAPLKEGQQVVVFENPESPLIPKANVLDALQRLQIPVKTTVNVMFYEDFQTVVLQYNDDPEVGWILMAPSTRKRDGSPLDLAAEFLPWQREHLKKPTIIFWESVVQLGVLCGFGIDMNAASVQFGRMAARALRGESVSTIKAEYPVKVSISLNRKTAATLGIVFSLDVLNLANVIFDDYDGKQVIRK